MVATRGAGIPVIITVNGYTLDGDYRDAQLVMENLGEPEAPARVLGGRAAGQVSSSVCVDTGLLRSLRVS
jgi:hypothetical protein